MKFWMSALIQWEPNLLLQGKNVIKFISADKTARVYNVNAGNCVSILTGHESEISKAVFNP
jgi:WD40 repeat protein